MSKVDAMRALREARRSEAAAGAARPAGGAPPAARPAQSTASRPRPAPAGPVTGPGEPVPGEARCGHRNMGGRSCTREADHVQSGTKNHRYG